MIPRPPDTENTSSALPYTAFADGDLLPVFQFKPVMLHPPDILHIYKKALVTPYKGFTHPLLHI